MTSSPDDRISKEMLFIGFAELAAARSTCPRGRIGAVLTKGDHPISIGYNGALAGQPHCTDVGCLILEGQEGCQRTAHAEANAIFWAAKYGIATEGTFLWCTHSPCPTCAIAIVQSGIARVTYRTEYRDPAGIELLQDARVDIAHATFSDRARNLHV